MVLEEVEMNVRNKRGILGEHLTTLLEKKKALSQEILPGGEAQGFKTLTRCG